MTQAVKSPAPVLCLPQLAAARRLRPDVVQSGAHRCRVKLMASSKAVTRQSVSLPAALARRVRAAAKARRLSQSRIIVELVELGLESQERERARYHELLDQLRSATSPAEQDRITSELSRLTFGS